MKAPQPHLLQHLFHVSSLDDVAVSKLLAITVDYPYFPAGHLLLSQKLKKTESAHFDEQVKMTAIYFHDPLWLHWQLNGDKSQAQTMEAVQPEIKQPVHEIEPQPEPEETIIETTPSEPEIIEPAEEPILPEPIEPTEEIVEQQPVDHFHEPEITQPGHETPEPEVSEPIRETLQSEVTEPIRETVEPVNEVPTPVPNPTPIIEQPVAQMAPTAEPAPKQEPLAFDPYYTIDYFASQGIKPPVEVQPGDKLGKQLKSFTEWLKTMKRLPQPAQQVQQQDNEAEQQDIRRFAAGSLEEKEVVTETMAEVLVKQHKREEAIAIYEKLSLLDPSKRAYFAAKIENLKVN